MPFHKHKPKPSRRPANKPLPKNGTVKPHIPMSAAAKKTSAAKPSFGKKAAGSVKKYQERTRKAAAALKQYGRGK